MIRFLIPGAAMLALAACGTQGAETEAANEAAAAAAANLAEMLPNELGGDDVSDANLSNDAEPTPASAPAPPRSERPAPKAEPRAEPLRPAAPKAPAPAKDEPDPHAGHDMTNAAQD